MPQVNPDGSEAGTRRNAAEADLNRNHVILSEPEVRALHELFLDWMPEVTLDIHETNVAKTSWMSVGYPVFDLRTWTSRVAELSNFDSKVVPLLTVERPWGYAIPAEQTELIALMERHRIAFTRLPAAATVRVERALIEEIGQVVVEDKKADELTVRVLSEEHELPAGTVVVPVRQPAANLIPLLLEPQSLWAPFGERGGRHLALTELIEAGTVFPVSRVIEAMELP